METATIAVANNEHEEGGPSIAAAPQREANEQPHPSSSTSHPHQEDAEDILEALTTAVFTNNTGTSPPPSASVTASLENNHTATFSGGEVRVEGRDEAFDEPVVAAEVAPLPKARSLAAGQVNRVVEEALPDGVHVSRDARVALQKAGTITLLYLACLAEEERKRGRKGGATMTVQDVHGAMEAAGFAHLIPLVRTSTKRTREVEH